MLKFDKAAAPMPPPIHMDSTPYFTPRSLIFVRRVAQSLAPVQPKECSGAI